jgi:hypothetical protein
MPFVVVKEVIRPRGGDMLAMNGGLERGNAAPFLDGVDQICGCGIGEGVGHLVEEIVGLDQVNDGGRLGGPEAFEAKSDGWIPRARI